MENPEIVINDESLVVPPKKKKRVPTQKQLDALALAREKRANNVRLKKETKGKPKGQTELLISNPEPIEIIKPVETIEEEEEEVEEVEEVEEPVEPPTPKKRAVRESRKKVIKIVKRKRVKKPPKEIIYENSSSESDDEELLGEVYSYYKKELKGRKSAKIKSQRKEEESSYIPEHFNLKFV